MTFLPCTSGARRITVGAGTGQIWLDNLGCVGNESTLASCPHPPFGTHNCVHNEDAGVRCAPVGKLNSIVHNCINGLE